MGARKSRLTRVVLGAAAATMVAVSSASAQPLNTDLSAYIFFGMRNLTIKNMVVNGACNTGVNCAQPSANSSCGVGSFEQVQYDQGSQIAADAARFTKGGASVWQLFSNDVVSLANVTVNSPPIQPLNNPILADNDGDGNPSCQTQGGNCVPDYGDLAAEPACAIPNPFPACNLAAPVLVLAGQDCLIATDLDLGNGRCDLGQGTYGSLTVQDGGKLTFFGGGVYTFCTVNMGKNVEVIADAATVVNTAGDFDINNTSSFGPGPGQACGQIKVNITGPGSLTFGRNSNINGFFCAPERLIRLGHNNTLTGRFFGDTVDADSNNRGFCCQQEGCACYDSLSPTTAARGASAKLLGGCVHAVKKVRVCGIDAIITASSATEVVFTVPAAIPGPFPKMCIVEAESISGVFTGTGLLTVN